ncbi:sensory box histidine kinase PhoR [Actinoplanes sp. SE50]|nr:sensory box histidine kinase PhoR [Actinoplanes sp. SE50/110]ATO81731.1 sensory box histidine kinase PhoR [Actinoplanes sp. SE50]SLL99139.1 sensory box histidine kinase PhoR [Actinoplanes sp. SE50/110]
MSAYSTVMAAVLVVEDNPEHQAVLAEIVRRLGHSVTVADDGRAGLATALAEPFDLIVADVDMPHLDGVRMCRALRAAPATADVPVVLITGYLPPGDTRLAEAGAAAVVPKPFSVRELTETLRGCLPVPADGPFLSELMRSLDSGAVACDRHGRIVFVNRAVRDFFGDECATVPIREWPRRFQLRHHDGTPLRPDEMALERALHGEPVHHADVRTSDRQRRPRWLTVNARPVRDASGAVLGAVAAMHDVTGDHQQLRYEKCKAEVLHALVHAREVEHAGAAVLRSLSTCLDWPYLRFWLVDEVSGRLRPAVTHLSPGAEEIPLPPSLRPGEGVAGRCWTTGELIWVADIRAPDSPVMAQVLGTGYRSAGAVPVLSAEQVVGVLTFFTPDRQDAEPALTVLLTGVAGLLGAYLERRRSDELANQLAASIGEYIALVGHELRTPLTSIATYTDLIAESGDDTTIGEVRDLLAVIERNNARLRTLVERLLDLSALESGHAGLTVGTVDLSAVLRDAAAAVTAEAGDGGARVRTDLPDRLDIPGDQARLRQVAENLIGNAVKYSPPGSTVTVTLTADSDAAVLVVTDTGMGIPAEERNRLFARLYRATNARHSGIPGAGLGLALSRAIVELHHGTITLTAGHPDGTIATVRLPLTATD